jgi:hypothetical protein
VIRLAADVVSALVVVAVDLLTTLIFRRLT